jgi:phosphatidylglycerophosphate synthase
MNLANIITISRIALIPPLLLLLFLEQRYATLGVFLVILAGDLIDGAVARWQRGVTKLGKVLDPVADKLLFASLMISLAFMGKINWLAPGLLAIQQIGLLTGAVYIYTKGKVLGARPLGKASAAIISLGLALALVDWKFHQEMIYLGIALSYIAGIDYLIVAMKFD